MTIFEVVLLLILIFGMNAIKKAIIRFHQTHALDVTIKEFIETYYKYQDVWSTDWNAEKIMHICNTESNMIEIGALNPKLFKNAMELRQYMLKVGEFIIQYSEILQEEYGYVWDEEEFDSSLEILTEIRRICIQKSEPSTATIGIKK